MKKKIIWSCFFRRTGIPTSLTNVRVILKLLWPNYISSQLLSRTIIYHINDNFRRWDHVVLVKRRVGQVKWYTSTTKYLTVFSHLTPRKRVDNNVIYNTSAREMVSWHQPHCIHIIFIITFRIDLTLQSYQSYNKPEIYHSFLERCISE